MGETKVISGRKRTLIFLNIVISVIGMTFLVTAMNTALPTIKVELSISDSVGQWLVSGYSLAMGVAMPLTAFLIHRIATKKLYATGIGLCVAGLIIDLVAGNFAVLMIGRVSMAIGNAILMSMAQVIILTIYPVDQRGKAMGNYGLAMGVAPVIASAICGSLVQFISWRAIFGFTLIFMAVSFVMCFFVFEDVLDTVPQKFDTISFVICVLAFGGITMGIGNLFTYGILSISTWPVLLVGVVAAVIFVIRQLGMETPFLDLRIMKSKQFTIGVIGVMLLYLVTMGKGVIIQQYYQTVLGWAPAIAGMLVIPGTILNAIVSPYGGRIYDKYGIRTLFMVSSLLLFVGCLGMCFSGSNGMVSTVVSTIFYSIQSLAIGLILMPLQTWGTAGAGDKVVDGTALLSSLRTLANSNGTVIATGVMAVVVAGTAKNGSAADVAAYQSGINATFFYMAVLALILFVLAFIFAKDKKKAAEKA